MSSAQNKFGTPDNTVGTLNGFFKETYESKLRDLIPDGVKLMNKIPFLAKDKQPGNLFHMPVVLGMEHGVTFASSDDDAFNLNPPIAGGTKDAQVRGNPVVLRSMLGYTAASRAAQGGKQAFESATKFVIGNMLKSITKKLEIELLYGQMGYGVISALPSGNLMTISTAEWAAGIWAGATDMPIEIRNAAGDTSRGEFVIKKTDLSARQIELTSNPGVAGVIPTDVIWHKGAYGNEFPGVHKILTSTGTLFNIDTAKYDLFRGNQYSASGAPLDFDKLQKAVTQSIEKGLEESVLVLVNVKTWADLLNDEAALRMYDSSYGPGKAERGNNSILYHSQNGKMEIEASIYVKEGYAYVLCLSDWCRVGSSDVTFKRPAQGDEFFRDLENSAGYEMRLWSDQALFCMAPGKNTLITNIVGVA